MVIVTAEVYRECVARVDYDGLLPLYRPAMRRYIEKGCEPGDALLHVLQNNLRAILLFDDPQALHSVVTWVNRELPLPTWGNRRTVKNWMKLAYRHSRSPGVSERRTRTSTRTARRYQHAESASHAAE